MSEQPSNSEQTPDPVAKINELRQKVNSILQKLPPPAAPGSRPLIDRFFQRVNSRLDGLAPATNKNNGRQQSPAPAQVQQQQLSVADLTVEQLEILLEQKKKALPQADIAVLTQNGNVSVGGISARRGR